MNTTKAAWLWGLAVAIVTSFPLTDSDIWWHLASAREMATAKSFLTSDPFTGAGAWSNVHWLWQWLVYVWWNLGGAWGLILGKGLLVTVAVRIWAQELLEKRGSRFTAFWPLVIILLFAWANRWLFLMRPLLLTVVLLGAMAYEARHTARWWVLGLLQLVLANSQGLFILGPLVVAIEVLCKNPKKFPVRRTVAWTMGLLGVSMVNPSGPLLLLYPFGLLQRIVPGTMFSELVQENAPTWKGLSAEYTAAAYTQAWSMVIMTLLWVMHVFRERSMRLLLHGVWSIFLAWIAIRNIPFAFFAVALSLEYRIPRVFMNSVCRTASSIVFVVLLSWSLAWWVIWPSPIAAFRHGSEALQFAAKQGAKKIHTSVAWGSEIAWLLHPSTKAIVDGRMILRDSSWWMSWWKGQSDLKWIPNDVDWIVLPTENPSIHVPLLRQLAAPQSGWSLQWLQPGQVAYCREIHCGPSIDRHNPTTLDSLWNFWQKSHNWHPWMVREATYLWSRTEEIQ